MMNNDEHIYIAIDLKSFYASVECVERGLDPLTTNLVVADNSRTEKTICLAVSPSLKQYGISGRARLFEVIAKVKEINKQRLRQTSKYYFIGKSHDDTVLEKNKDLELDYVVAPPRMAHYLKWSTKIHEIYLKYVSADDIHVYSIDEVFMDVTHYLKTYQVTAKELAKLIIQDVFQTTGITATAGIGTNLYLCKIAMDIVAKHIQPDKDGVRIACLNEKMYRQYLWNHKPITDFWRVGKGYAKKLEQLGLYTMGDIAKCSVGKLTDFYNEDLLYETFGVNAELLIDHAWGYESCTMKDIKSYKPENNSIGAGQVLSSPYSFQKARIVMKEMLDSLALTLVSKDLVTNQIIITVGYDKNNSEYSGEITEDRYGRKLPKHAHGTVNLDRYTSSSKLIVQAGMKWFDQNVDQFLKIRRMNIAACQVVEESTVENMKYNQQLSLFMNFDQVEKDEEKLKKELEKEKRLQKATLQLKEKYGKNAVLKALDYQEGATARERNDTIGGHKA